jgi:ABC-2 type transport system ATP-binding protein
MIEVQGLTKYYGPKRAVNGLNFRIGQGEIVGLLGLNGSGKTTVLRILAGGLLPTSGSVRINGLDLLEDPHEVKKLLSFLPESPPLYGEMTVRSFLQYTGQLKGMSARRARESLAGVAARTSIEEVLDEVVEHLSFGYRQRVGIAMSLMHDPELLLLDEPAAGLDPVQIVEMRQLIRGLKGKHTVIFSSHFLSEISQICDRILVIQDGEIIGEGTEEELSSHFARQLSLRLQVRGSAVGVVECLRGRPGVDEIRTVREEGDVTVFSVKLSLDVREELARALVGGGYGVLEMARTDLELESVFLKLMKRGEGSA